MKIQSLIVCIQHIIHKKEEDIDSIFDEKDEKEDNDIQFGKQYVAIELINITTKITLLDHESLVTTIHKINLKYYVNVVTNSTMINKGIPMDTSNLDVNIDEATI
jgi:hypothetical protein